VRCAIGGIVKKDLARHLEARFSGEGIWANQALAQVVLDALSLKRTMFNREFLTRLQDMLHDDYAANRSIDFVSYVLDRSEKIAQEYGFSFSKEDYEIYAE